MYLVVWYTVHWILFTCDLRLPPWKVHIEPVFVPFLVYLLSAPPPTKAKVLFSWQGSKDNHLSLNRGAVLTVYEQNEKWWSGELGGKVGWFPKTFVKIIAEGEVDSADKGASKSQETMWVPCDPAVTWLSCDLVCLSFECCTYCLNFKWQNVLCTVHACVFILRMYTFTCNLLCWIQLPVNLTLAA